MLSPDGEGGHSGDDEAGFDAVPEELPPTSYSELAKLHQGMVGSVLTRFCGALDTSAEMALRSGSCSAPTTPA